MIEIEWSKVKKAISDWGKDKGLEVNLPETLDTQRHIDGVDDTNWCREKIIASTEGMGFKYYSIRGVTKKRGRIRYDIFFWKEKPELVEEI